MNLYEALHLLIQVGNFLLALLTYFSTRKH